MPAELLADRSSRLPGCTQRINSIDSCKFAQTLQLGKRMKMVKSEKSKSQSNIKTALCDSRHFGLRILTTLSTARLFGFVRFISNSISSFSPKTSEIENFFTLQNVSCEQFRLHDSIKLSSCQIYSLVQHLHSPHGYLRPCCSLPQREWRLQYEICAAKTASSDTANVQVLPGSTKYSNISVPACWLGQRKRHPKHAAAENHVVT